MALSLFSKETGMMARRIHPNIDSCPLQNPQSLGSVIVLNTFLVNWTSLLETLLLTKIVLELAIKILLIQIEKQVNSYLQYMAPSN